MSLELKEYLEKNREVLASSIEPVLNIEYMYFPKWVDITRKVYTHEEIKKVVKFFSSESECNGEGGNDGRT